MALYCYWDWSGGAPTSEGEGSLVCIEVPDEIEIPPEEPDEGEADADAEITLPDGTTIDATALLPPFVGLKEIAWLGEPWKTLFGVRTDGTLVSLTYDKDEDVWGWARHPMNNGAVTSICVIPSATDEQGELWAMIQRVVDGQNVHYIERMAPRHQPSDSSDKAPYIFPDCALTYSGAAATSFSGADHLKGLTCRVWADGVDVGDVEIAADGTFSIDAEAETVAVGIHTDASMVSLPTARLSTERQIVQEVVIRFSETLGGKAGTLSGQMDTLNFRAPSDYMDTSPPLWDGDKVVTVSAKWDDSGVYSIIQDTAGPMTILATFPKYKA
jgi:hypothetical protein